MKKIVKATASWKGGMRVDAQARGHGVIIDQVLASGGKDAGANPMEFLLFSLGGCLGTIAAIIANQEQIELRGFDVSIEGDYDPAFLLGKSEEGRAGFTEIRVSVDIDADMSNEQKQAFFQRVDERCPISDNLINNSKIVFDVE
ncbi:MAG: OsmC family protein [Brevefilum sp.]